MENNTENTTTDRTDLNTVPDTANHDTQPQNSSLSLWELMRKDVASADTDDPTSRVLSNPRTSIWDM